MAISGPSTPILKPGDSGLYTLTVTPVGLSGLPGNLTLSVVGAPQGTTVTLSSSDIPAGSPATEATVTVQISGALAGNTESSQEPHGRAALGLLLLPIVGILSLRRRLGKISQFRVAIVVGALSVAAVLGLAGCASSAAPKVTRNTVVLEARCGMLLHSVEATIRTQN
jgi:hypothetical protein